jgi:hypothetical protein
MAAALRLDQAKIYVETVNAIFGSHHTVSELVPICLDGKRYYIVLFAGHRRHLTILHINAGIESGTLFPTERYAGDYRLDLYFNIKAEEAIELQFHENRHAAPPLHEEASAAWRLYRFKRIDTPELTVGQFAKTIGRTTEWVRNALRFCALPDAIQAYVTGEHSLKSMMKKPELPYGILVHLARFAEKYQEITHEELTSEIMHLWLREALVSRLNVSSFGKKVSGYLEQLDAESKGQVTLFGADVGTEEPARRLRRIVAQEYARGMWVILNYLKTVQGIHNEGLLGHESYLGPFNAAEQQLFSPGSPIRISTEVLSLFGLLLPDLTRLAQLERTGHFRRLQRGHPLVEELSENFILLDHAEADARATPH